MNPTLSAVHIDQPLSSVLVGYFQDKPSLARRVFGEVTVDKQSNNYFVWNKGDLMRDEAQIREPGTAPAEFNMRISTDSYKCEEYALRKKLTDELAANADFSLREPIAKGLAQKIMISESRRWVATYMATSVWATDSTLVGANQWSDGGSNPIGNVRTARRTILTSTGYEPNIMVMSDAVADALVDHPDLRGRMSITNTQNVAADNRASFLSMMFGLEVIIDSSSRNTAAEGQTATMAAIMSDNVLIAYKSDSPAVNEPSAGYIFKWSAFDGAGAVRTYPDGDPGKKTEWLEANSYIDMKVVAADCGYLLVDVLA